MEKRSENFGRVQAGSLDEVVDRDGFFGAEQYVDFGGEEFREAFIRAARTGVGSSSITSSALRKSFAPCWMS
jgi:hypothetical protein